MRIVIAQINPKVGDLAGNSDKIIKNIKKAKEAKADIVLFSELCLCGYPPDDFLLLPHFMDSVESYLKKIIEETSGIVAIVGVPRRHLDLIKGTYHCADPDHHQIKQQIYNSAAIIENCSLIGFQDKWLLPTYDVFTERRYFESGNSTNSWDLCGKKIGITICEDIWQHSALLKDVFYEIDPILALKDEKPDLLLNLSASPFSARKFQKRLSVCSKAASTLNCPVVLCNQVGGNDSLIFDGYSLYVGSNGELLNHAKGFEEDQLLIQLFDSTIDSSCQILPDPIFIESSQTLYQALVLGLRDYLYKSGFSRACLGLSGGVDSALVACLATEALGAENVFAINMPSRYSSEGSREDARKLSETLGIKYQEISIESPFQSFLDLLLPCFEGKAFDVTEENLQARIRGMILMAISNKLGYIVLSTGNKSELAMGYATLYGDMCGGLGVISDVSKMQVYALAHWINRHQEIIPTSILHKPPSAELRPNQKDSDSLPDYEIIDHVLQSYLEEHLSPEKIALQFNYPLSLVENLIKRIHRNEYKRRQSAPGLRVTEKAFFIGRRFPIVQGWI